MRKYSLINNILGWVVFLIASIVYLVTAEPTASWWDCGEYIATAYKLQVGHPPGAPTFQLFGRIFSLFAGSDVTKVAYMINAMSAICSGLTILMLFWTITMLAKKLIAKTQEIKTSQMIAIFGSGIVGALAYTFSDTFWYSAVEGEVYAMSSFFTALVFWAILKWESQADDVHNLRWIILITFLIGISIGVHLLNLLAIPAMAYVFYFKKYPNTTKKGVIWAGIISLVMVAIILYFIVPMIVSLAGKFEIFFINSIGLPFNSGTIIFFALLIGLIAWGLKYSKKKAKPILNTIVLSFLFLLIGYSTFLILVIRANANTPINENAPKDAVALLTYLNREQYGDTPLLYGQYYTARAIGQEEGSPKYIKDKDIKKYIKVRTGGKAEFNPNDCTVFPRMYSPDEGRKHITYYKYWAGINGDRKPTFSENLKYFFRYQVNHMYWRYFMWNFAGRQNDIQGFGLNHSNFDSESNGTKDLLYGNWISGISFIDNMRLGPQTNLPNEMANNPAKNKLYLLPLLLGIAGLIYQFQKDKKDAFVVFLLFFMTGLAIVLYLNQPPQQPRERDYAYAGSFYAFAIWIGLGVYGIYDWLKKIKISDNIKAISVSLFCLIAVPILMAFQNWDDHDRSGRYMAREFARNYLESCEKDAILITFGDNDTFPLWYVQEVEGVRPDVRILNFTLSGMHWYVEQLYSKIYDSEKAPFTLPKEYYGISLDHSLVYPESGEVVELKDALKRFTYDPKTTTFSNMGDSVKVLLNNSFKITSGENVFSFTIPLDEQQRMRYLQRNELMLLDILATNAFKRPIYTMSPQYFANIIPNINDYIKQEGIVYRIMPTMERGSLDIDKTYNLFMNKFQWGGINNPNTYLEDAVTVNNTRNMRQQYMNLAKGLTQQGEKTKALQVLDKALYHFPSSKIYFDKYDLQLAAQFCDAGNIKKGEEIFNQVTDLYINNLKYFNRFNGKKARSVASARTEALQVLALISSYAKNYNFPAIQTKINSIPEMASLMEEQELQDEYNSTVNNINIAVQLARNGKQEEGANQLIASLGIIEKLLQAKSQELRERGTELLMFVYSNAMNHQLKTVEEKIMSNPTLSNVIQVMMRQQQAQMQVQNQNTNAPGINF
jgi:thioredoxin-like negative regulator of GroEL